MFAFSLLVLAMLNSAPAVAQLQRYDTKYYTIYTDISPDEEKEAAIRMTKMAEEYHQRTRGFAGVIQTKFPFYLYKHAADYYAAGGMAGSAGMFMYIGSSGKLMAIAGLNTSQQTWHVVQHEGFHQFAHAVIGGEMPIWLNEGLAEYFGESIFTGDGFVSGIIPPWRLERLKDEISSAELKSTDQLMKISSRQWAAELNIKNYDQAWSMVHFLVQGDEQRYQGPFSSCICEVSAGTPFTTAWSDTIGSTDGFEDRWKQWWLGQPKSPTRVLYGRAAVATMTSYVARAFAEKQTFADFKDFESAVDNDTLKMNPDDWLPRSLIVTAFKLYGAVPGWELKAGPLKAGLPQQPIVQLTLSDNTRITGSFTLRGKRIDQVNVDVDDMATVLAQAQQLLAAGKKDQAKEVIKAGLRNMPKSAMAADAKKLLRQLNNG
jgi:hypothetical protein